MTTTQQTTANGIRILPVTVRDRIAVYTGTERPVCDNSGYTLRFTFDAEWEAYPAKTVRIRYFTPSDGWLTHDIVFTGEACEIPRFAKTETLSIGVYAGDLRTSTEAEIPCLPSALSEEGTPADPPEDVYHQLLQKISTAAALNEEKAEEIIRQNLAAAKESGEFDGKDGFSPSVTVMQHSITAGGGVSITVTDENGTTCAEIHNGSDGHTPERGVDYWTEEDRTAMAEDIHEAVTEALVEKNQPYPAFASSMEELENTGDTAKLYVLPDGYIYAWKKEHGPLFTNLASPASADWVNGYCFDDNNPALDPFEGTATANYIEVKEGDYLCVSGIDLAAGHRIGSYREDKTYFGGVNILKINNSATFSAHFSADSTEEPYRITVKSGAIRYVRFSGILTGEPGDVIITKNEPIAYGESYRWVNTGHAFIPADYEDRILALEEKVAKLAGGQS